MIDTTPVEHLVCMLCGEPGFGPTGFSICMNCLAAASHCRSCASEVTVMFYPDETVTLDVEHAADCRAA